MLIPVLLCQICPDGTKDPTKCQYEMLKRAIEGSTSSDGEVGEPIQGAEALGEPQRHTLRMPFHWLSDLCMPRLCDAVVLFHLSTKQCERRPSF